MIEWDGDVEYDGSRRKCRVCGCTNDDSCPGGCWWVELDLCSACQGADDA